MTSRRFPSRSPGSSWRAPAGSRSRGSVGGRLDTSRSRVRPSTTSRTSTSGCRSACSAASPASPARASRRSSTRSCSNPSRTVSAAGACAQVRIARSAASSSSTRSSPWTSHRSDARRGRTRRPTSACSTRSATCSRGRPRRAPAATSRGASPSTSRVAVARSAKGDGQIKIEMHFLPDVYVPCEQCHGKRYNRETLEVRFKGKNIADVLEMSIGEALEFFAQHPQDQPPRADAARRRTRLHAPRPAGDDAVRR